jgi:CP family cyanate transporter-like MFS transporter
MTTTASAPSAAPAASVNATSGLTKVSLWKGRVGLIIGIVLLGITLRYAITGMSPLLTTIREDMGIDVAGASFLGMLPTLSFGIAGFLAPVIIRRWSPELTAALAMILAVLGTFGRAMTDSVTLFFVLSAVALFGMGFGNVVGAPLVKKYFPDRQAAMLTVFALLMQAGATLPAMTAIPLADAAGWRFSIASWGIVSLLAALPWIVQLVKVRKNRNAATATSAAAGAPTGPKLGLGQLIKSPIAIGTALFYAMASLNTYAMLAWMPTIFQAGGMSQADAAAAFSVFTFLTLPMAAITPILASKLKNVAPVAIILALVFPIGYTGIIINPELAVLWAFIAGIGGGAFPLAITMFNKRTRTPQGSASIAGFSMGTGYLFGTLGPLLGGALFAATGGWTTALVVFALTSILAIIGGLMMTRGSSFLEDKFAPANAVTEGQ